MTNDQIPKPLILCILDGWGERHVGEDNAILKGDTPTWDRMKETYPISQLQASALEVGLPSGQMGNSEVGHLSLGAGRVVMQNLPRINNSIADGSLRDRLPLKKMVSALKESGGICHIMGLVSPGGVHSHQDHITALAKILENEGITVCLHAFLDGRDTPPSSATNFIELTLFQTKALKNFSIGTVIGRYYAMDRDNNWDRVEQAYLAIVDGKGKTSFDASNAIKQNYAKGVTDEFIPPTVLDGYIGMKDGDAILMSNFRADRVRQILASLVDPLFKNFDRPRKVSFSACTGLSEYSSKLNQFFSALFPQKQLKGILGEIVSSAGLKQLRIAETEKYAHVTFFFNGGKESKFPGEDRILIPSPKVTTYDLKPEMSALEITDELITSIENQAYDLIVVNYANGDMVGHTGVMEAAVRAAETIDQCLGRLENALLKVGGTMLITADHGNLEKMSDETTGQAHTAHTLSPVPIILVNAPANVADLKNGVLSDVAPTLVRILGLTQPVEMTGSSLILENKIAPVAAAYAKK
ncbi:MAG: 2,3-bisphosphoglycerate-independent phosphoglycerate mutase [Alphaproteobacteria bacterium MarineAlpha3_Bin6]|nr:MAG: 2,3-bisphosphoglycerate-independent phosphoglycerate mutase [Alphaproteobacteria bacterium MarineAlpha3_Bin6]